MDTSYFGTGSRSGCLVAGHAVWLAGTRLPAMQKVGIDWSKAVGGARAGYRPQCAAIGRLEIAQLRAFDGTADDISTRP